MEKQDSFISKKAVYESITSIGKPVLIAAMTSIFAAVFNAYLIIHNLESDYKRQEKLVKDNRNVITELLITSTKSMENNKFMSMRVSGCEMRLLEVERKTYDNR